MEDLVAIAVEVDTGETRYFLTWGRIQDNVDPEPLEAVVLRRAGGFDLGGDPIRVRVCDALREAREAPYFYEALFSFAQRPIPYGDGYEAWRAAMSAALEEGRELYYLGR